MVWHCHSGWQEAYLEALDTELEAQDGESRLLDDLAAACASEGKTWEIFRSMVLPIMEIYDIGRFKSELVSALEALYRDPRVSLAEFGKVAFAVSCLLDEYGIEDDDMIEFAYADGFLEEDPSGELTRANYEAVFARFGAAE